MFFYIFKGGGAAVYSPEFGRGGLDGIFNLYVWQVLNSPNLTVTLEGRSNEDTAFASVGVFSAITTVGAKTSTQTALPEILRYKFEVAGSVDHSGVAIELLAPVYRNG
jgi:hypothetical protein